MQRTASDDNGHFNPHSRKGSDRVGEVYGGDQRISIHTPARGVTNEAPYEQTIIAISIHTPARGVTLDRKEIAMKGMISIHTPARGVTFKGYK